MAIPKFRSPVITQPMIKVVSDATIRHVMALARCRFGFTVIFATCWFYFYLIGLICLWGNIFIHGLHGFARIFSVFVSENLWKGIYVLLLPCGNIVKFLNRRDAESAEFFALRQYFYPRITRICTDFFLCLSVDPNILRLYTFNSPFGG